MLLFPQGETMSGKDWLAVLAMILPSLLLIAIIAFTLGLSADVVTAPPGVRIVQASPGTEKARDGHNASMNARPRIATQKLMRDPWEKPVYAKSSRVSEPLSCDLSVSDQKAACFYW